MQFAPFCVTLNVALTLAEESNMLMWPVRVVGVVFACMLYPTDPLPVPLAPEEMVIHKTSLTAVRAQLLALAVTDNVPVVDFSRILENDGATVKLQAAVSVMENVAVPIAIVAVRLAVVGFGSTE